MQILLIHLSENLVQFIIANATSSCGRDARGVKQIAAHGYYLLYLWNLTVNSSFRRRNKVVGLSGTLPEAVRALLACSSLVYTITSIKIGQKKGKEKGREYVTPKMLEKKDT